MTKLTLYGIGPTETKSFEEILAPSMLEDTWTATVPSMRPATLRLIVHVLLGAFLELASWRGSSIRCVGSGLAESPAVMEPARAAIATTPIDKVSGLPNSIGNLTCGG